MVTMKERKKLHMEKLWNKTKKEKKKTWVSRKSIKTRRKSPKKKKKNSREPGNRSRCEEIIICEDIQTHTRIYYLVKLQTLYILFFLFFNMHIYTPYICWSKLFSFLYTFLFFLVYISFYYVRKKDNKFNPHKTCY